MRRETGDVLHEPERQAPLPGRASLLPSGHLEFFGPPTPRSCLISSQVAQTDS